MDAYIMIIAPGIRQTSGVIETKKSFDSAHE